MKPSREGRLEAADTRGPDRKGQGGRSRRGLLAAGAGLAGLAAAETIAWAAPAQASNGQPVLLGTLNKATAATQISALTSGSNSAVSLASGDVGVEGAGISVGVTGTAVPGSNGDGVQGTADGSGTGVTGVAGAAEIGLGVGVTAQHVSGGTALQVLGTAVFSRSGTLTIKAGAATATQTGVTLTAASLILATLQRNLPGVYVQSAVPDAANSSFTVHLSKAALASATVAWFIVN